MKRGLLALFFLGALAGCSDDRPGLGTRRFTPGAIRHVFLIILENKGFEETFGPDSKAPFFSQTLRANGQLLTQYYGIGHLSLTNYVALVSGQGANPLTQSDCQYFTDFIGLPVLDLNGQAVGLGCVYPPVVRTLANQLEERGLTWRGYMEDMGNSPTEPKTCRHPELNAQDHTQQAKVGDQYAARHNPFVYFHSIIDTPSCDLNVVPLTQLSEDLGSAATTPNYAFITPNLCNDGHDAPCVDGAPGGLESADQFLGLWVPQILNSPAFDDAILIITFDEAEALTADQDSTACCNQPVGPNTPLAGITGPGGGRTGALVLSPFVMPGTSNGKPYNHFALLRTVEDLFDLEHLGYAGQDGLAAFGEDVFNGGS